MNDLNTLTRQSGSEPNHRAHWKATLVVEGGFGTQATAALPAMAGPTQPAT